MSSTAVPYEKGISHVSFENFDGDEENDDLSDEDPHVDDSAKRPVMRKRTSSVFSLDDYVTVRKERSNTLDLKGQCEIIHQDTPTKRAQQVSALGYFEQKSESDNVELRRVSKANQVPQFYKTEQRRESRAPHTTMDFVGGRRESRYNRNNSIFCVENKDQRGKSLLCDSPDVKYTNTYALEPSHAFDTMKVKKIIQEELEKVKNLPSVNQNIICLELANDIKKRVKMLNFSRYKYIVLVTMGENKQQGMNIASRSFWDEQRDSYVTHALKIKKSFIVGIVYALYSL